MKYLPRSRVRGIYSKKVVFFLGLFIALALLLSFFDTFIVRVISPLWRAENTVTRVFSKSFDFFSFRNTLIQENTSLKERLFSLELELSALAQSRAENELLLTLLGRRGDRKGISATILTHPPQSPYDLLVVDAGSRDAVVVGAQVTLPEGPEVGVVSDVYDGFSRVRLFTTPGEKTQGVLERYQVPVELEGRGGGNFKVVVPRDTEVVVGDRILSAALNASLIAIVGEVNLEATDSFKEVLAKSPANIFTVRFLTILP